MIMKKILLSMLTASFALGASGEVFSPGGVSFDFSRFKNEPDISVNKKDNVLRNGNFEEGVINFSAPQPKGRWRNGVNVHGRSPNTPLIKKICSCKVVSKGSAEGKYALCLNTPGEVVKLAPKMVISNRLVQEITIPETKEDTVWTLSFKSRGHHLPSHGTSALVILYAPLKKVQGKKGYRLAPAEGYKSRFFTLRSEWSSARVSIKAPAGTAGFYICPALYGAGTAYLDDMTLTPSPKNQETAVRVSPQGFMDNLYAVGEGLPAMINFAFAADKAPERKDLFLEVTLPAGFQALGTREFVPLTSRKKNPDGTTQVMISLKYLPPTAFTRKFFKMHAAVLVVKAPGLKAGTKRYPLRYRLVKGAWKGKEQCLDLQIIPALYGKRPAKFRSAAMMGMEFRFKGEMAKQAALFYGASGFSCVHGAQTDLAAELKKLGIIRYRGHYYICNGFRIGKGERPESAEFKLADGKAYPRKICPVEVYREGPFFKSNVVKLIEDLIVKEDAAEHIMTNWEPYYLNSKGCFCLRCREEFIKWAKGDPSAAEITAAWPKETLQRHGSRWAAFRSWQHGRLMVTLEKTTRAAGARAGKESHFIPEVSWSSMTPQMNFWAKQYNVTDYISELPWLEPWGPYTYWRWDTPYSYYPAPHLTSWLAAEQVREFARSKSLPGKMPKLIAFPHGRMGDTTISQPEGIAFEMLSFFLQKWQGAFLFTFPGGYDYRYWRNCAKANTLIAEHEEIVGCGKDVSAAVKILPRSPYPENPDFAPDWAEPANGEGKLPGLHKLKIFQHRAFLHKGEYLVAVGNFWKKGELFFTLQLKAPGKGKWHVSAGKYDLGAFSPQELEKGILLQGGALRWQFICLSPQKKKDLIPFDQGQMKALFRKRLPAIRRAAAAEEKLHRSRQAAATVDLSRVKSVSVKGIKAVPAGETVVITAERCKVVVDLKQGGRITELQSRGESLAAVKGKGWFAVPGVWYPRNTTFMLNAPMELRQLKALPGGVRLELYRKLTPMDQKNMSGAGMVIRYDFLPEKIIVAGKIINETDDALEYAFRFHSMPGVLGRRGDVTGGVSWEDGVRFRRGFLVHLYHYGALDPLMTGKEFNISSGTKVMSRKLTLGAPFLKSKLAVALPENVRQVVFWDSASQENSTFEVIYDRKILHPGEEAEYTMSVAIK